MAVYKLFSKYMKMQPIRKLRYFSQSVAPSKVLYRLEQNIINPSFTANSIPESLLALSIHNNVITYLHMTSDYDVKHWSTLKLYEDKRTRSTVLRLAYQELVWEAVRLLPSASLYLMEDTSGPVGERAVSLPVALWQCRIETTLVTLLNAQSSSPKLVDNSEESTFVEGDVQGPESAAALTPITPTGCFQHAVYKLKPSVVGRYFDIFVAGRRTSCSALAENIAERRNISDERFMRVRVSLSAAENFRREGGRATKDQMGYCLLEAIYFYNQLEAMRTKKSKVST